MVVVVLMPLVLFLRQQELIFAVATGKSRLLFLTCLTHAVVVVVATSAASRH